MLLYHLLWFSILEAINVAKEEILITTPYYLMDLFITTGHFKKATQPFSLISKNCFVTIVQFKKEENLTVRMNL